MRREGVYQAQGVQQRANLYGGAGMGVSKIQYTYDLLVVEYRRELSSISERSYDLLEPNNENT